MRLLNAKYLTGPFTDGSTTDRCWIIQEGDKTISLNDHKMEELFNNYQRLLKVDDELKKQGDDDRFKKNVKEFNSFVQLNN